MTDRVTSQLFNREAFGITIAAHVLAQLLAAADVFHRHTPFSSCDCGWSAAIYGAELARRAGGTRRSWQVGYVLIAVPFVGFWGLDVEIWASSTGHALRWSA